jgi:Kef-type K+ transport system membrane component KefB
MHFLSQTAIFLVTAVLLVPLFRRAKLGAVIGYLAAGIPIGPHAPKLIGDPAATGKCSMRGAPCITTRRSSSRPRWRRPRS